MRYALAAESLRYVLENTDNVAALMGPPGVGKTEMVRAEVAALKRPLVPTTLATVESVDLRGLPVIDPATGAVKWARPDFIQELYDAAATGRPPVLFIDEFNCQGAPQAPLMQLCLEKRVGPHKLPAGTSIVVAGNRQADRAAATQIGTALRDRLTFIDVETELKAWLAHAAASGLNPMICAFLMLRGEGTHGKPGLLHWFDPTRPEIRSFPTPRGWFQCHRYADAPDHLRHGLMAGKVGDAAAAEFEGFVRVYRSLPPILSIINNPTGAPVPSDPSTQYAVAVALSRASNPANFQNVLSYMRRVGREFEIVTVTDAIRRNPELCNTQAFIMWAASNADVAI